MGFQLYFFMKGVKKVSKYSLAGNLFEFIPFLSFLPAVTAGVVATIISERISATRLGKIAESVTVSKKVHLGAGQQDFRAQRLRALYQSSGRERERKLGHIRKQEAGELGGRALYGRRARVEEREYWEIRKEAEKRAERKYRPGWEPEALAKEEKERQKIEKERNG